MLPVETHLTSGAKSRNCKILVSSLHCQSITPYMNVSFRLPLYATHKHIHLQLSHFVLPDVLSSKNPNHHWIRVQRLCFSGVVKVNMTLFTFLMHNPGHFIPKKNEFVLIFTFSTQAIS